MGRQRDFPTLAEVIMLAEKHGVCVSAIDLAKMHKRREFTDKAARELWPDATPRYFALVTGRARYDGAVCQKHGMTARYTACRSCVECKRGASAIHRQANLGRYLANGLAYRTENQEYCRLAAAAYRLRIKEQKAS